MPIKYTDRDGRVIEGGTTHIYGWSCVGCVVVAMLAIVGAGYLISGLVEVLL